jgi:hypothetical protein
MHVVFIHGPPAVGKHTIGTILSERTGLPLFHNHLAVDAALSLFQFGSPQFNVMRAQIWLTGFREAALTGRSFIFTFAPEATVEPSLVHDLIDSVSSAGGSVHFVELSCARSTILERLANTDRVRFRKLTDPAVFESSEREGRYAFPPLPNPIIRLNTDEQSPAEAAEKIAGALSSAVQ